MFLDYLKKYDIILGSKSPRRADLLRQLDIDFRVDLPEDTEEDYPKGMDVDRIAAFIAEQKSMAYRRDLDENQILITADTIVCQNDKVLMKPRDRGEAKTMLLELSANTHYVITGVALRSKDNRQIFTSKSLVRFHDIFEADIDYYIDQYKPYDKAGAYGIQEWIGFVGVEYLEGSFYNVMGLPVQLLYHQLMNFTSYNPKKI